MAHLLKLRNKREVVGNLIAARLSERGVGYFSFGEYFESKPLIEVVAPEFAVLDHIWVNEVAYRVLETKGAILREVLASPLKL